MEVDIWNIVMSYDLPDSIQLDLRFFFLLFTQSLPSVGNRLKDWIFTVSIFQPRCCQE